MRLPQGRFLVSFRVWPRFLLNCACDLSVGAVGMEKGCCAKSSKNRAKINTKKSTMRLPILVTQQECDISILRVTNSGGLFGCGSRRCTQKHVC